jgi:hypothetical protein
VVDLGHLLENDLPLLDDIVHAASIAYALDIPRQIKNPNYKAVTGSTCTHFLSKSEYGEAIIETKVRLR